MEFELVPATLRHKPIVRSLLQFYLYDFSEMEDLHVDFSGHYVYPYLDNYWTEPGRYALLVRCGGHWAGFALVRTLEQGDHRHYQLAEFFIMRRYRRRGLGRAVAAAVFDRFPGRWEVNQIIANTAATAFWRQVIGDYTNGGYTEDLDDPAGPTQWFNSRAVS
jgi:predicted acetyltransferase